MFVTAKAGRGPSFESFDGLPIFYRLLTPESQQQRRDAVQLRVLQLLKQNPEISQRELANALGVSLGKTHYVLQALIDKGFVKVQNFRRSERKVRYLYQLTPVGLEHKLATTKKFLLLRMAEYELIRQQIDELRRHLPREEQQALGD